MINSLIIVMVYGHFKRTNMYFDKWTEELLRQSHLDQRNKPANARWYHDSWPTAARIWQANSHRCARRVSLRSPIAASQSQQSFYQIKEERKNNKQNVNKGKMRPAGVRRTFVVCMWNEISCIVCRSVYLSVVDGCFDCCCWRLFVGIVEWYATVSSIAHTHTHDVCS